MTEPPGQVQTRVLPDATDASDVLNVIELTFANSSSTATLPSDETATYVLPVPDGTVTIRGQLIGYATSHKIRHHNHANTHAARGEKCPACRWFEVRIFAVEPKSEGADGRLFAVHTQGPTIVPGEYVKCRLEFAMNGYEVMELLTVRHSNDTVFMPAASSRAVSQAAGLNKSVETAYVNRAVA